MLVYTKSRQNLSPKITTGKDSLDMKEKPFLNKYWLTESHHSIGLKLGILVRLYWVLNESNYLQ